MYQKVTIIGNLGRDPESRFLPNGDPVCSFSVATTRKWTDANGQKQEKTVWFRVAAWRKLGEICQSYLHKGSQVFIEGELSEPNVYQAKSGEWKASLELTAREVKFLGSKQNEVAVDEVADVGETETIPFKQSPAYGRA